MARGGGQRKRTPVVPEKERADLREALFYKYYGERLFEDEVRRLKPRWESIEGSPAWNTYALSLIDLQIQESIDAGATYWTPEKAEVYKANVDLPTKVRFRDLVRGLERDPLPAHVDPALHEVVRDYVQRVDNVVVRVMRLAVEDRPASWASNFLHQKIARGFAGVGPLDFTWEGHEVNLTILLGNYLAGVRLTFDPVTQRINRNKTDLKPSVSLRGNLGFDKWEELEKVALEYVSTGIRRLRSTYEDQYPHANPASLKLLRDDVVTLHRFLLHRERTDKNTRDRLRRMAEKIGIDLPR